MKAIRIWLAAVALLALAGAVSAHQIPVQQAREMCAQGYVGPRTVYGETKSEAAAKQVMYDWYCLAVVNGKAEEAFEKYVSKDVCDHSHMLNAGLKACGNYTEMLGMFRGMGAMMSKGATLEFPLYGTVNGDLVTHYGEGVDIFRVNAQGKITDHWDASPPADVTLKAHDQAFSDRMQQQIDTGKRAPPPAMGAAPAAPPTAAAAPAASGKTYEERMAGLMATFRESPAEEAARQVVLKRFRLQMEGKALEAMKLLSPEFTEHMTPARMPKDGKTAYQRFLERAQRTGDNGQPSAEQLKFPFQARASEDLVTLFHNFGCDIFRVRNGLVTDHWDCTPWEPFSNKGERAQLEDMAKQQR